MTWPPVKLAIESYLAVQDGPTYLDLRHHFELMKADYVRADLAEAVLDMCADGVIVLEARRLHLQRRGDKAA